MTAMYRVIMWRAIPAQVKVPKGKQHVSRQLSQRFQAAIDGSAMRAEKTDLDDYMAEWRIDVWQERECDPETITRDLIAELECHHSAGNLRVLVHQGGLENG